MAKILIVDDDPDIVDACRLFLEKQGYTVTGASSRADGMQAIASHKPDLLVLDIMMEQPDDGIAMAQELRRQGFKAPILMLTSISKVTGMEYGRDNDLVPVDGFLEKPVQPATLVGMVKQLLGRKEG